MTDNKQEELNILPENVQVLMLTSNKKDTLFLSLKKPKNYSVSLIQKTSKKFMGSLESSSA